MKRKKVQRTGTVILAALTAVCLLAGCGSGSGAETSASGNDIPESSVESSSGGEKVLTIGSGQATSSGLDTVLDYDGW